MSCAYFPNARAVAEIDTAAIAHNYRLICAASPGRTIAVVKANAYGHGLCLAVPTLLAEGCDFFAVATLDEALAVRALAPRADVLILGYTPPEKAPVLQKKGITQTVFSLEYARALSAAAPKGELPVHLKIDGGMCRLGFAPADLAGVREAISLPNLAPRGLFCHFGACVTDPEGTRAVLRAFCALRATLPRSLFAHAAASAAALSMPSSHLDGVRVGLALYGYAPLPSAEALRPALRLLAPLVQLRRVPAGTPVGYDGAYRTPRDTTIGVLPVGYADGVFRSLSGMQVTLFHRGECFPVPIVGHICMDQLMVDLGDAPATVGDSVCLFSDARVPAAKASSVVYEILSALSTRVERRQIGG